MTHYIKFEYTYWDRYKRLTRQFFKGIEQKSKILFHRIYIVFLLIAGYIGFLGCDPKFFPKGGLIQKAAVRMGIKIRTYD